MLLRHVSRTHTFHSMLHTITQSLVCLDFVLFGGGLLVRCGLVVLPLLRSTPDATSRTGPPVLDVRASNGVVEFATTPDNVAIAVSGGTARQNGYRCRVSTLVGSRCHFVRILGISCQTPIDSSYQFVTSCGKKTSASGFVSWTNPFQ